MTATKQGIAEKLHSELGFPKKQAIENVEVVLEIIKATLESGEDVLLNGFGKFCVKEKAERKGRNPTTGEEAILSARRVVTFKWSSKLKELLNGK